MQRKILIYHVLMLLDTRERRSQGSVHMDAIRGMAAVIVMLGHSRDLFFESLNTPAVTKSSLGPGTAVPPHITPPQISIGNEAVMIFFVLSGYLVGGSVLRAIQRSKFSWKEYLTKRVTRLWMVLLPALLLTIVLDNVGLHIFTSPTNIYAGPAGQDLVIPHLRYVLTLPIIAGNAVFLQNIVVTTLGTNIALWSLSNEFWYYMIFPLVVLACWRASSLRVRISCALLAVALLYFIGRDEAILFPTWLLGALISLLPLRLSERTSKWSMVCLIVLLLPVMEVVRRMPVDIRVAQSCIALYFGLTLYVVLNRSQKARAGIYSRAATFLSDLSYPLYLVHLPILVLLCAAINQPWHQWSKTPAHFAVMLVLDMVAVAAAYLLHLCFQRHTEAVRLALLGRLQQQQHVPVRS